MITPKPKASQNYYPSPSKTGNKKFLFPEQSKLSMTMTPRQSPNKKNEGFGLNTKKQNSRLTKEMSTGLSKPDLNMSLPESNEEYNSQI